MGYLNSFIKFVVFNANAILFFGGWGVLGVAVVLLRADFIKLAENYVQVRAFAIILGGIFIACLSVVGCVGTHRQIQRNRMWSGRRVLSLFQLLLLAVIIGQGIVLVQLYRIEVNLEEAGEGLPDEYGKVENRFRVGFNDAYFEQLCSDKGDDWIWSLVDEHCPSSISQDACPCGQETPASCSTADTYTLEDCCPDKELCEAGINDSCPYTSCRKGVIELLLDFISPALEYSIFALALEGSILILTCLLICYNPRDSTEDILITTGALKRKASRVLSLAQTAIDPPAAGFRGKVAGAKSDGCSAGQHYTVESRTMVAAMTKRGQAVQKQGTWELSTPVLSPTTNDLPSEPLLQFMSPRKVGSKVIHDPDSPEGYPGKSIGREQEFDNTEAVTTKISSSALAEPRETMKETAEPKWPTDAAAARVTDTVAAETTNCGDPHTVPQHGKDINDLDITAILQNEADKYSSCSSIMGGEKKPDQGASKLLDHDLQPRDGQTLAAGHKERYKGNKEECAETLPLEPSNATLSATAAVTPSMALPLIASTAVLESSLPATQGDETEEILASASLSELASSGESPAATTATSADRRN